MNATFRYALCVLAVIGFVERPVLAWAKENLPQDPIVVNGDRVEYFPDRKQAVGTGNVSITYKDVVLTCDRIIVYLDTHEAIAEGGVKVTQKDAYYTGDKMNYNFDTKKGTVIDGYLSTNPFYGRAETIEKVANKEQFNAERGYITTCDLEKPHYRVQSRDVKIYLEDKVVARNTVFYVGDVPVFYLPYYIQPFIESKNYINVIPGQSDDWGYYVLNSVRLYIDNDNRVDGLLDYRSKRGIAGGANYYYDTRAVGDGAFKVYYAGENNSTTYERRGTLKDIKRYRYQWRHKWDMGPDTGTVLTTQFNKVKDRDFIREYFYNEYAEEGDHPESYASFITARNGYSAELIATKRFDKFYTAVERLPEYKTTIYNWQVTKDLPIFHTANFSAAYLNKTFDNVSSNVQDKDLNVSRIDVYNRASYAVKVLGSLHLTPYAGVENTFYSRNRWGDTNQIRTIFDSGIDASMKFYKIYDIDTNFANLDINKLRHVITPTVGYRNVHQPTIDPANLNQFDGIDSIATSNGATFLLENRLQTKRPDSSGELKSVDLATFLVSTYYNFRLKKGEAAVKNHDNKFDNFNMQLELKPYDQITSLVTMGIKTKTLAVQTYDLDLGLTSNKGDYFGIGQRYEKTEVDNHNQVTAQLKYKISDNWRISIYERFNVLKSFEEQEYTIIRDLHCWQLEIVCNVRKDPADVTLWAVMTLKAFPTRPIGYRKSYSRAEFGPIHNI